MIPDLFWAIDAVEEENTTWPGVLENIDTLQERELVAGDKIGLPGTNQIRSVNSAWPEAQVGDRDRPRFL